jgi:hypothetical protein
LRIFKIGGLDSHNYSKKKKMSYEVSPIDRILHVFLIYAAIETHDKVGWWH